MANVPILYRRYGEAVGVGWGGKCADIVPAVRRALLIPTSDDEALRAPPQGWPNPLPAAAAFW